MCVCACVCVRVHAMGVHVCVYACVLYVCVAMHPSLKCAYNIDKCSASKSSQFTRLRHRLRCAGIILVLMSAYLVEI